MSMMRMLFYVNSALTAFGLYANIAALEAGVWNIVVGQSLLVCPAMSFICYKAWKQEG